MKRLVRPSQQLPSSRQFITTIFVYLVAILIVNFATLLVNHQTHVSVSANEESPLLTR